MDDRKKIRSFIAALLSARGQNSAFTDDEELVQSGRLDSMALIELVVFLEDNFELESLRGSFTAETLGSAGKVIQLLHGSGLLDSKAK